MQNIGKVDKGCGRLDLFEKHCKDRSDESRDHRHFNYEDKRLRYIFGNREPSELEAY